ncbi:glycosyltransferase [Marivirga sp.]|uniref:glycosyltransferase n=1 Tax=Marivirga sp. TaxID=2018662 RepID=UPI003DA6EDF9
MEKLGFNTPTIINAYNPFYGLYSRNIFQNEKIIYYCYDEISGSPWAKKHGAKIEKEFLKIADLVITSSSSLQKEKAKHHNRVEIIENGVDFELFNSQMDKTKKNSKPIVGYIGSLDERIDYELIAFLASKRPNFIFRLIGRVVYPELLDLIRNLPNIELIGPVQYRQLPKELLNFDLCLIPFLKTEFTKNIYPLKINEYLSMGKPVVKTDFASLPEFNEVVWTGSDYNDFLNKMEEALTYQDDGIIKKRIQIASDNSWANRIQKFLHLI